MILEMFVHVQQKKVMHILDGMSFKCGLTLILSVLLVYQHRLYWEGQARRALWKLLRSSASGFTAVRPASTLKNTVILAATLFSGARVYYALR